MTGKFERRLRTLIKTTPENMRARVRADVDAVLGAGIRSEDALVRSVRDVRADPKLRQQACWILARFGGESIVSVLCDLLADEDPRLRAEAARGLGVTGANSCISELTDALRNDKDTDVRVAVAYALGLLGERSALESLVLKLGDRRENTRVRGMAAEALADIGDRGAVVPLIEALQDDSPEVRFWSAFALGQLGDREALKELERLAAFDHSEVPGHGTVSTEAKEAIRRIRDHQERFGL